MMTLRSTKHIKIGSSNCCKTDTEEIMPLELTAPYTLYIDSYQYVHQKNKTYISIYHFEYCEDSISY